MSSNTFKEKWKKKTIKNQSKRAGQNHIDKQTHK